MAKALIDYNKDLPEIPGRIPWQKPESHLLKDDNSQTGWRIENGRRPSQLLLITKIREKVDQWREEGYPGASEVTKRLFEYWFEEDHEIPEFPTPFRYYFCQREAIESFVWLIEIAGANDTQNLVKSYATIQKKDMFTDNIVFQTTMDGQRQIRRYIAELGRDGVQDLPPENLRRFAFKMATGTGKTWVMAMAIVWAYYHKKMVEGSDLSTNFLIVAPNVIVYQRLHKDFTGNRIFHILPLVPPEWGKMNFKVILRGDVMEPDSSNNLFLTNIHQLYESRDQEWTPENAVDAIMGRKPALDISNAGQRSMLERVKTLKDLIIMNDEAHHVHDDDLAWNKSLLAIHQALPKGLNLWLDFSATPKDQNGMYFPWTICDYPLAQAVEDRIVKAPLIVTKEDDSKRPIVDPDDITAENITDKFGYWIQAAVMRWKDHDKVYKKLNTKSVLFIMAEKNAHADAIGKYLWKTKEFGFKESEVLVIHTDTKGEISKGDVEDARIAARDIDKKESTIKVIVSVMMLREGWDVRNVSVVLGLRPFSAKAEILPEQVIGRGLRLMTEVSPDRTQTLEVLGTQKLLNTLRTQLEAEGVGVGSTKGEPVPPVIITPVREREEYDIAIPITKPSLMHNFTKLGEFDVNELEAIYKQEELAEPFRVRLNLEFATTETEVHQADIAINENQPHELIASITNKVIDQAKLTNKFAELYPITKTYLQKRCFGKEVDLEYHNVRSNLSRLEIQEGIAKYIARKISELTVEHKTIEFDNASYKLSLVKPFTWRRNLPPLELNHTIFNYVATYNDYERHFAEFLDKAKDVKRFATLGTTQQGDSGTQFRVDYLKPSGAIGFYHPDWVVVQKEKNIEVNWIVETKGRVWESTAAKDTAMKIWCEKVSSSTGQQWKYIRVNQSTFDKNKFTMFEQVLENDENKLIQ